MIFNCNIYLQNSCTFNNPYTTICCYSVLRIIELVMQILMWGARECIPIEEGERRVRRGTSRHLYRRSRYPKIMKKANSYFFSSLLSKIYPYAKMLALTFSRIFYQFNIYLINTIFINTIAWKFSYSLQIFSTLRKPTRIRLHKFRSSYEVKRLRSTVFIRSLSTVLSKFCNRFLMNS